MLKPRPLSYDAVDDDTWAEIEKYCTPRLKDDEMEVLKGIARHGDRAPDEPVAGRDPDGASDRAALRKKVAAIASDVNAEAQSTLRRARHMRHSGLVDAEGERRLLSGIGQPEHSDPKQFPHSGRLKR